MRYADGSGRCELCKIKFRFPRIDKLYCSERCRQKAKYRRLYSSNHYCIVCNIRLEKGRKYCGNICKKLLYRLKRTRKAVDRISNIIRVRRCKRSMKNQKRVSERFICVK